MPSDLSKYSQLLAVLLRCAGPCLLVVYILKPARFSLAGSASVLVFVMHI